MESEHRDIIDYLQKLPRLEAPVDFRQRAMARIPEVRPGWSTWLGSLLGPDFRSGAGCWNISGGIDNSPALHLILAAVVHLTLAWALAWKMPRIVPDYSGGFWVAGQPLVLTFLGLWLLVCGVVAWIGGGRGRRAAGLAILGYVQLMAVNLIWPVWRLTDFSLCRPFLALNGGLLLLSLVFALRLEVCADFSTRFLTRRRSPEQKARLERS